MGAAINVSDADMAATYGRNSQANHIVRAERVVLRVISGPLTTQREVVTFCYLLHCLLGTQGSLCKALKLQIINTIDEKFDFFLIQMATIHRCTAFAYDVSCIMGDYLNYFVKALAMVLLSDPGGRIPVYFQ